MTITEFLLARIAWDEECSSDYAFASEPVPGDCWDGRRVQAECESKRAIMELHSDCGPCPTLRTLAAIWADHPDYDPAWRVQA